MVNTEREAGAGNKNKCSSIEVAPILLSNAAILLVTSSVPVCSKTKSLSCYARRDFKIVFDYNENGAKRFCFL